MPNAPIALLQAPMVTEGSPFSMRCKVTLVKQAASAATVALRLKALRRSATLAPRPCSLAAVRSVTGID